jgi:hypothetical protein
MNNLQILEAQIEEEITKTKEWIKRLNRSEASDWKVENERGYLSGLQTALQLIRNQIAQAKVDTAYPTIATTEEPAPEAADSYHKLLPELKQACSADEVNISDLTSYAMRIKTLKQAGELTEKQLDKLNPYMKELEASCFAKE